MQYRPLVYKMKARNCVAIESIPVQSRFVPRPSPFAFVAAYQSLSTQLTQQQRIDTLLMPLQSYEQGYQGPAYSPWDLCLAQFLRSIYERSYSKATLKLYGCVLYDFFTGRRTGIVRHPEDYSYEDINHFLHVFEVSRRHPAPSISAKNHRLVVLSSFYK